MSSLNLEYSEMKRQRFCFLLLCIQQNKWDDRHESYLENWQWTKSLPLETTTPILRGTQRVKKYLFIKVISNHTLIGTCQKILLAKRHELRNDLRHQRSQNSESKHSMIECLAMIKESQVWCLLLCCYLGRFTTQLFCWMKMTL